MKKLKLLLSLPLLFALSSCLYMDVKSPGQTTNSTEFQLTSADFQVLDRVSATGVSTLWFGAVLTGGEGYQALLAEAQELGGDAIMNYSFDFETKSILSFIYAEYTWRATGLAVKYADRLRTSPSQRGD